MGGFSFSIGTTPSSLFGIVHEKKTQPSKTTVPKGNPTGQIPKEKVVQPNKFAPTAKVRYIFGYIHATNAKKEYQRDNYFILKNEGKIFHFQKVFCSRIPRDLDM